MAIGQSIDGDVYISGCGRGIALVNQQILDLRACGRNIDDEQGKEQPVTGRNRANMVGALRSPHSTTRATGSDTPRYVRTGIRKRKNLKEPGCTKNARSGRNFHVRIEEHKGVVNLRSRCSDT